MEELKRKHNGAVADAEGFAYSPQLSPSILMKPRVR